ncbi:undecaprenyl-diphosphate phosphatase [Bythopirellula polymerisocia]|uniref:Undecaprenyl-diphosphatase n=1 Tax=Bythopirellula polymerisocia TaxID=2528003 RepID=A0A5C6CWK9_9BACT|nr:undecaprenyl-diphosphate phosphatase [Bythopirellula polymerisocia]TWU28245.1 Undecaprenyl-diphosphatase [Bythopirellula polymerisocia]
MTFLEIILLAVVQGLTEFLPVSSSGHLVVANAIFESLGSEPVQDLVEVEIVLHLGTLLAVLVYYRREIMRLFTSDRRVIPLLILGTIPAAVIGIYLKKGLPDATSDLVLENPLVAGICFPITAGLLWWASQRSEGTTNYTQLSWQDTIKIGLFQAVALLPGISRSGSTIAGGLSVGLQRESAATFAFLLAIPAIAGGGLLEMLEAIKEGTTGTPMDTLAVGFAISFAVGLVALTLLIRFVRSGRLAVFAYYLVPLGLAVVGWQLVG